MGNLETGIYGIRTLAFLALDPAYRISLSNDIALISSIKSGTLVSAGLRSPIFK